MDKCADCNGRGAILCAPCSGTGMGTCRQPCTSCRGQGAIHCRFCDGAGALPAARCHQCSGTGQEWDRTGPHATWRRVPCERCNGSGAA